MLFSALLAAAGAEGGCAELGRCCAGRSLECASTGWRPDRSYGLCYCDQACLSTLDCCSDYRHFCPEASCLVSDWSEWSGCAERCKATYRLRRRHVIQKPRNGGEACPPLEEKAGCLEYWTQQGTLCKDSILSSKGQLPLGLVLQESDATSGLNIIIIVQGPYDQIERTSRYCVEFQLMAITKGCLNGNSSYTHWMKYLSEGHTVCVECQHPALDQKSRHCSGDGSGAKK
ncbi:hypothetical protein Chor_004129 [Crotalus horridus]